MRLSLWQLLQTVLLFCKQAFAQAFPAAGEVLANLMSNYDMWSEAEAAGGK